MKRARLLATYADTYYAPQTEEELLKLESTHLEQNDWLELTPRLDKRRPFDRARIILVQVQQDNYIDTTVLDLAMVIAGEMPKVDLAEILAMTRDGSK